VALGGNTNISTLKPLAWHEIMESYARHKLAEAQPQADNTASLKLPSWFDLTKDITFKSTEALYAAKEIYSRIAACQLQA